MRSITKSKMTIIILLLLSFAISAVEPYKDTSLPLNERVADLISKMTLTEKIAQLGHQSPAISRLGIKSYNYWNEALHGVARSGLATSFPQALALSSTWNPDLIYDVATAISDEARVKNNTNGKGLTYWSPTINMARDPRWGRAEENYGEDPYLAAQIAIKFIQGLQGNNPKYLKTVATAKHFACNNVEKNRKGTSSEVDERSLREYYLPAFESTIKEGNVISIMSAYNAVNGVPSPANRTLLENILRNEWGFTGFVVSDCDANENVWEPHGYVNSPQEATAISLINGTDLNCGSTSATYGKTALDEGLMTEKDIDLALHRIFAARFMLGEFDPAASVPYTSIPDSMLDCKANRELALRSAREAIVLLKNANSILPLDVNAIDTIALIGPNANAVQLGGYSGSPLVSVSTVQGVANKLGVDIASGLTEAENFSQQNGIRTESCDEGGSNIGYIQNGDWVNYENIDFGSGKTKIDIRVATENSGGELEVILDSTSGTSLGSVTVNSTGGWQNWTTVTLDIPNTTGKHTVYLKFNGGSGYLFNVNWFRIYNEGDVDPLAGSGRICYAKGCDIQGAIDQTELSKAVELAKKADVAVVVCGTDLSVADEGTDRSSLALPGSQEQLIQAVFNANPNTIVVLVNGFSLAVNWAQENVPAIVSAWYDGQAQGTAIADVLFGDYNPAGRLSTTWYKAISDLPDMSDYDIKNNRTYMYFKGSPLYPFGHGLSYTDFTYSNMVLSSENLNAGDSIAISVDITNSGAVAGDEVVQLYTHAQSVLVRPIKELKGFKRINLQPSETKTVTFYLKHEDLKYYNETTKTFVVEDGNADIYIGSSSEDVRLNGMVSASAATVGDTYRHNPFSIIQAEKLEGKSATVSFKPVENGNLCVNLSGNDSHIVIKNFNFNTESKSFHAYVSSLDAGSSIEVVVDNIDGSVVGTLDIQPTSDLNSYSIQSCDLSGITGVRDVYFVLKGSSTANCNIDWISFKETITSVNDAALLSGELGYQCNIFPNPARTSFSVKYSLPEKSAVAIDIYSTQGTNIKSLNHNSEPGSYKVELNCTDESLLPGMYIVKFSANSFRKTQMVSVVR